GADGQTRSLVMKVLQTSADAASHMFEIPHKFPHSLFIIRSVSFQAGLFSNILMILVCTAFNYKRIQFIV
ncbi:MAG: hypothetical protein K5629_08235, partial [Eubacteriales bacterium]|nr:hypothetical protein [Eubacteriales bacterium]